VSGAAFELDAVVVKDGARALLDGVSLVAERGSASAIIGPVGCGKTTLLRLLAGLVAPAAGRVRVLGDDLAGLGYEAMRAHRLRVGFAFESTGLLGNASIGENVALPLRYHRPGGASDAAIARAVAALAEEVGLGPHLAESPVVANASVRKRALLARALVLEPELVLCDEPQLGLTQKEASLVSAAIERRRKERGLTVVLTDHDGWFEPYVVDRIWYLEEGRQRSTPTVRPPAADRRSSDLMPDRPSLTLGDIYLGPPSGLDAGSEPS
jgi:ABC-type transporter Mla maintaining outer membrane lipid asymmetry ATPase subunit MlaF